MSEPRPDLRRAKELFEEALSLDDRARAELFRRQKVDPEIQREVRALLDAHVEAIQAQVIKMGGLVEAAIVDSTRALVDRDIELATPIGSADQLEFIGDEVLGVNETARLRNVGPANNDAYVGIVYHRPNS